MTALIEAANLTVRFGEVTALDGLTVSAPAGQVLAVLGRNGAGKSTFVRTTATLLQPDEATCWSTGSTFTLIRWPYAVTSAWPVSSRRSSRR